MSLFLDEEFTAEVAARVPSEIEKVKKNSVLEITFTERPDVTKNPDNFFIGDTFVPWAAFIDKNPGLSHALREGWTLKVWSSTVDAPVDEIGVILLHTRLTPGEAMKEEIWISASKVRSIRELTETTFG